ncbi:SCIII25 protein [Amanita muscaria]
MRFSIFVSSTFVLAGMSAALPVGRADMLVARFADSDFLELYARGGGKKDNPPSYQSASRDRPPEYRPSPNHPPPLPDFRKETDYAHNHYSPDKLVARGNSGSKTSGGDKERKDGKPPKYKVAAKDPPPRYEPSEHYPPPLGPFLTVYGRPLAGASYYT